MKSLSELFNNREIAVFFWLSFVFICCLSQKKIKESIFDMLKILFSPKLLILNIFMFLYITFLIFTLHKIHFWNASFLKDTIFWFFSVTFVLLINYTNANKTENFFKNVIWDNLKLIVLLEFIMNMYTFHLAIELILIPFLVLLELLTVLSGEKKEYKVVKKILDNLLSFLGLSILIFSIFSIIKNHQDIKVLESIHSFVFTPIMTIAYLPFLYLAALSMLYETIFARINLSTHDNKIKTYVKRKLFTKYHINLAKLKTFSKQAINLSFTNKQDVDKVFTDMTH